MPTTELLRLYTTEQSRLRRLVQRITGSSESAEDIVHDAFLKLSGRDIGAADLGLFVRTAQNLARDTKRAERVRYTYAAHTAEEQIAAPTVAPDQAMASRQELNGLFDALKSLPQRTQRIFLMSKLDEMTHPQIAAELGVSVSTVEKEMISALQFCRAWKKRRDLF
ncbi:RNA polymerase sigma factor [Flaviflagellibacter deserti]|jgi:RNA polymerase sigma factor (sigma-70 family)|uniref:RNA polymerase sigma factor n=1 Tax=Flaviflagellibacter deserti TaxID=2267266 RepID=A0ABV9YWI2_9HYPH